MAGGTENAAAHPAAHARKTADLLATIICFRSRTAFCEFDENSTKLFDPAAVWSLLINFLSP